MEYSGLRRSVEGKQIHCSHPEMDFETLIRALASATTHPIYMGLSVKSTIGAPGDKLHLMVDFSF